MKTVLKIKIYHLEMKTKMIKNYKRLQCPQPSFTTKLRLLASFIDREGRKSVNNRFCSISVAAEKLLRLIQILLAEKVSTAKRSVGRKWLLYIQDLSKDKGFYMYKFDWQ